MASYLGSYKNCAADRENKFHRAIKSALAQTFKDFELFIVSDGCEKTMELAEQYSNDDRVRCSMIKKQPHLSGNVRNFGIANATGEWILFLDTDDKLREDHLEIIDKGIQESWCKLLSYDRKISFRKEGEPDWVYFNDFIWNKRHISFRERECHINRKHHNGTSNIAVKRSLGVLWKTSGYDHDYHYIKELLSFTNYVKIKTPGYLVCHIPGAGGYDI